MYSTVYSLISLHLRTLWFLYCLVLYISFFLLDAANIQIIQNPNPAPINEIVTLNCSATSEENIDEIKWKYNNKNMNEHTPGVLDLPLPQIDRSVGFSILKLSVKDNDGKNWPGNVICIVELVPDAHGNKLTFHKPYSVNITG